MKWLKRLLCPHNTKIGELPTLTGDGWETCTRCGKFRITTRVSSPGGAS